VVKVESWWEKKQVDINRSGWWFYGVVVVGIHSDETITATVFWRGWGGKKRQTGKKGVRNV
jgi:hypothetical protein